ncbi:hypothetical protein ACM66B_006529 [Microbotryomycetes sp. NB124-2]
MLAFSGGPSSRAMLDMVAHHFPSAAATAARDPRHVVVAPFESVDVVFVDESTIPGQTPPPFEDIRNVVASTPFQLHVIKLEDVFDSTASSTQWLAQLGDATLPMVPTTSTASPRDQLRALLATDVHSATSLETLHAALLQTLLRRFAAKLECDILFTGETATRLAVKCVSGIAQGRGFAISEEMAVSWDAQDVVDRPVMVSRPMSMLLSKEVAFYLRFKGLSNGAFVERPTTRLPLKQAGIESLVEGFVSGLDADFPSTVSTILRTSQKLGMRSAAPDADSHPCPLCGLPSQKGAWDWRHAITISSFDRAALAASSAPLERQTTTGNESGAATLGPLLCYSCLLVLQNPKDPPRGQSALQTVPLPSYVQEVVSQSWHKSTDQSRLEQLRSRIDQYILANDA